MEQWGQHYRLGIIWQDYQHKELIDRMFDLEKAISDGTDKTDFYSMVNFLESYIDDHFALEEVYMEKYDYPRVEDHIKDHRKFSATFKQFKSGSIYQESKTASELIALLSEWVHKHMMVIDKALAKFLIKKGVEPLKVV